jgi:hypothetical protein
MNQVEQEEDYTDILNLQSKSKPASPCACVSPADPSIEHNHKLVGKSDSGPAVIADNDQNPSLEAADVASHRATSSSHSQFMQRRRRRCWSSREKNGALLGVLVDAAVLDLAQAQELETPFGQEMEEQQEQQKQEVLGTVELVLEAAVASLAQELGTPFGQDPEEQLQVLRDALIPCPSLRKIIIERTSQHPDIIDETDPSSSSVGIDANHTVGDTPKR